MAVLIHGNLKSAKDAEKFLVKNGEVDPDAARKEENDDETVWIVDDSVKARYYNKCLVVYGVKAEKSRRWKASDDE